MGLSALASLNMSIAIIIRKIILCQHPRVLGQVSSCSLVRVKGIAGADARHSSLSFLGLPVMES